MQEDEKGGARRTEGTERWRRPQIPQEKLVCAGSQGCCPQLRPRSLTSPGRPAGVRRAQLRLWHSGRWLLFPPPPTLSPPSFPRPALHLPQEIPPLPPPSRRIGREGPSRPRSRAVSQSPRPRPHARQAPPLLAPVQTRGTGRISACAQVNRTRGRVGEAGGRERQFTLLRSRVDSGRSRI